MSEQEISRPKIFVFCNGGSTGWYEGAAIAEDGTWLAGHICSSPAWVPHDMGLTSDWKHEGYDAHYPNGYELVWVEDPKNHEGLEQAYQLNQELTAKEVPNV